MSTGNDIAERGLRALTGTQSREEDRAEQRRRSLEKRRWTLLFGDAGIDLKLASDGIRFRNEAGDDARLIFKKRVGDDSIDFQFIGQLNDEEYTWTLSMPIEEARRFKQFKSGVAGTFQDEIAALGPAGTERPDVDNAFCTITSGIMTMAAGPGGILYGAACFFFANNGIEPGIT